MPDFPLPLSLQLSPGETLRWTARQAARFTVVSGRVWFTRAGDRDDHFLHAGERGELRREAAALIGAEGPACVRIEAPAGRGIRLLEWLQKLLARRSDPPGLPAH